MTRESITYRRADLYAEVWAEPLRTVAKRHGISDVALGKLCRKLNVPVPGLGYWAKKAAGQEVEQTALPRATKDAPAEVTINRWVPETPPEVQPIERAVQPEVPAIPVPAELVDPHPLVAKARDRLLGKKPDDNGLVRCTARRCLKVVVAPASLDRALRLMDSLLKACEQRGIKVEITPLPPKEQPVERDPVPSGPPPNKTRVQVDGEWIYLRLFERGDSERDPAPTPPKDLKPGFALDWWIRDHKPKTRYIPNGLIELWAESAAVLAKWRDYKRTKLETRLGDVMAHLPAIAAQAKREREEAEQREREWQERRRLEHEAEQRRWEAQRLTEQNLKLLERWRLARDVREFAADAKRIVSDGHCTVNADGPLQRVLTWAASYAAETDPLTPLRKEIERHVADRAATEGEKQRVKAEQRTREEAGLGEELFLAVTAWRQAQGIREYVAAMTSAVLDKGCTIDTDSDFARSVEWSLAHADRIDPVALTAAEAMRVRAAERRKELGQSNTEGAGA